MFEDDEIKPFSSDDMKQGWDKGFLALLCCSLT